MAIPDPDLTNNCEEYFGKCTCQSPILQKPSCIVALFHNSTEGCRTIPASPTFIGSFQLDLIILFQNFTELLVQCGNNHTELSLCGLYKVNNIPGCELIGKGFNFYTWGHQATGVIQIAQKPYLDLQWCA